MIQGVLFDMDGLMFDTERIGRHGWYTAARELGITIPDTVLSSLRGTGVKECRQIFNSAIPGRLYDTARAIRLRFADEFIAQYGLPVKPGLYPLLSWLRENNIPAALATSSNREKAMGYLHQAGVADYFSGAAFGPEVPNAKPAPDVFLLAAASIHADPNACVVLEDSPNGLKAARAAGCRAIVVPDLNPAPPSSDGLWDAKVSTLADVIPVLSYWQSSGLGK